MKKYKNLIIGIATIIIFIVGYVTWEAISENENWSFFNLDFKNRSKIIGAYGTLISGLLAFLSILFLAYGLLEQKEKAFLERRNKEEEYVNKLKDTLVLISSFLTSVIDNIEKQGETFETFAKQEIKSPTLSNTMQFSINKNFNRIIEMDYTTTYKAIRHFFVNEKNWEKEFLNLYTNLDFYIEAVPHLFSNYKSQVSEKTKLKYELQELIQKMLVNIHTYRNCYFEKLQIPYEKKGMVWFELLNKFWFDYKIYIDYMMYRQNKTGQDSDLSVLNANYFIPFHDEAVWLRQNKYGDLFDESKLIDEVGSIIVKIKQLEQFGRDYATDLKIHNNKYFSTESKNLNKLKELRDKINLKLNIQ